MSGSACPDFGQSPPPLGVKNSHSSRILRTLLTVNANKGPVRLAVVDDYEIVVAGLAHMFDNYRDRIQIVQLAPDEPVTADVDVALFDTFAQGEADQEDLDVLVRNPHAKRVVVYTWAFDDRVVQAALAKGASGYLSKTLPASDLVDALERVVGGEIVVSPAPSGRNAVGQDWPGREEGLSERESEIIALITQGKSNAEIAELAYLSINSVKTYIRTAYAKMGVSSRTQAVLWGVAHGFHIEDRRIDWWRLPE
jgi:DNA-binding NarL/FixJ family response regulator